MSDDSIKCAGCPEPAIGYDSKGTPLCDGCANLPDIDTTFPVVKINKSHPSATIKRVQYRDDGR